MTQEFETLSVERSGGVATLTLNRPRKKNAITGQMFSELLSVLREVQADDDDRVLVVTGAGGDFCSGADLSAPAAPDVHPVDRMRRVATVALALHDLTKPSIAKVRGVAVGAGCNLALGCDLVVASRDARFSEIFAQRGLSLDFGGSWLLPRLVGLHKAKELALLADILSASQANEMGLVNRVLPDEDLDEFATDWARRLAAGPPVALSLNKRMLNDSLQMSMAQALEEEGRSQVVNFATTDTAEARNAFLDKRAPVFTGGSALG